MISHYAASGDTRQYLLGNNTAIVVTDGDNLVFDVASSQIVTLLRKGPTLTVEFAQQEMLRIEGFFVTNADKRQSLLTFTDTLYTAEEIEASAPEGKAISLHELQLTDEIQTENVLYADGRISGSNVFTATSDTLFAYQFRLADDMNSNAKVTVKFNGRNLPKWLKLQLISSKNYLLSGVPSQKDLGNFNIEIIVEIPDD